MRTLIDGKDLRDLSVDQLAAALQAIASELSVRGNEVEREERLRSRLLWAFDRIDETARMLRRWSF